MAKETSTPAAPPAPAPEAPAVPTVTDHPVTSPRGSDGKFAKSPTFAASGPQDVIKWDDKAGPSFERADEIRDRLAELGWVVRDSADGPSLVPKT